MAKATINNTAKKSILVWHDLTVNPKDLPDDTDDVLDESGNHIWYDTELKMWRDNTLIDLMICPAEAHPKAWAEIPLFENAVEI